MKRYIFTVLTVLTTLLYPAAIWLWHGQIEPRMLALVLVLVALLRIPLLKISRNEKWWLIVALLLALLAISWNKLLPLQLYPVFINAAMLIIFGYSLFFSTPIVERFARLREPNLSPAAIIYTRRVTQVWCGFFIINGSIALFTALYATPKIWFLYNGLIAYLLMGLLFGIEYLVRLVKLKHAK